jgi:NAD(P)-dependent dehydrogenase (short-subunit alcohol dehydrogenase family)
MIWDKSKIRLLITGGTSGLGLELVKFFLEDGCEVHATGRNCPGLIIHQSGFHFIQVDFSDLEQVRSVFARELLSHSGFDLVVNCAGVLTPPDYTATIDGFEYSFQVNFLAHLMICDIIINSHKKDSRLKLAFVTSPVYKYIKPSFRWPEKNSFRPFRVYCESKYYMLLIGSFLKSIYKGKDISVLALDPGIFSSGIYRMQKGWFRKMYRIGAPFMRSSHKVAMNLHNILTDEELAGDVIYKRSTVGEDSIPALSTISEKFLLSCHKAVKIVR